MTDYNADAFETLQTFETTVKINGTEQPIEVEDLKKTDFDTLQEYQQTVQKALQGEDVDTDSLPPFSFEDGDGDRDFMAVLIDHKVVKPDIDPDAIGVAVGRKIIEAMAKCWTDAESIEEARAEMPTEGNG